MSGHAASRTPKTTSSRTSMTRNRTRRLKARLSRRVLAQPGIRSSLATDRGLTCRQMLCDAETIGSESRWCLRASWGGLAWRVVPAPDQAVDRDPTRDVTQARDQRNQRKRDGQDRHQDDDPEVGIGGVEPEEPVLAREWGYLVPHRVQPQPGLAGVTASFVHHPPLAAGQFRLVRKPAQVAPVTQQQRRLGVIGLVK